jgi:hypothetical protein
MTTEATMTNGAPATPEAARAELEQLRLARVENKVTQADYLARSDYLARLAAGEQDVQPPAERLELAAPDQQERRIVDELMQPAQAHQYRLPPAIDPATGRPSDELEAVNTAVRTAMAEAGVPQQYGGQMYEQVNGLLERFAEASPDQVRAHTESVGAKLRETWGGEYAARVQAVNDLLAEVATKNPVVAELLDEAPHAFADPWVMQSLWNVAEHRARGGRR